MFKKISPISALVVALFGLSACATGESLSQSSAAIPSVTKGKSRLVVYRTGILGAAIQPKVLVDGQETDTCQPNKVFYVDVPAGRHTLSAKTEAQETLVVDATAGAATYIECTVTFGIVVGRPDLKIVDSSTGRSKIGKLVFSGVYQVR